MPAYRIDFKNNLATSVVVTADTPAQAIRQIASNLMICTTINGEEVAAAVAEGLKIIDARQPQRELNFAEPAFHRVFQHKEGCTADPWTAISGKGCTCTKLDIPAETSNE